MIEEPGIHIPMRDGVRLVADVCRPEGAAGPVPVLVTRTPYGRTLFSSPQAVEPLVAAGFAVVAQDCRGRFDSEGDWEYVRCEIDDGYDTVEWAAAQRWSNGRIGMFGASYMANTQWMAAIARPPHLEVLAPECCPSDYWTGNFEHGVFRLGLRISWTAGVVAAMAEEWGITDPRLLELRDAGRESMAALLAGDTEAVKTAGARSSAVLKEIYRHRPLRDGAIWGGRATWLEELFAHEQRSDAHWRRIAPSTYYDVLDLPAIHTAGWYDIHLPGTLENYSGMRRQAATERARDGQRLVIGPWGHWSPFSSIVGDVDFGSEAVLDSLGMRLAWFGHWLQDGPAPTWAPVRIFVMGVNRWRDEQEWPLARTQYTPWYLHSGGSFDTVPPDSKEEPDEFVFDPNDPVPSIGGRLLQAGDPSGPRDQRPTLDRDDVVLYTSAAFRSLMEITGPVSVDLWAATDRPDTDFTATLIDVHPDGLALNICEGAVRARHAGIPLPLVAGAAYRFTIDLAATSIVLLPGHRLAVLVSSSRFPEWEPNPNTGNPLGVDAEEDLRPARQAIFHDAQHPSRVVLPIIPRDQ